MAKLTKYAKNGTTRELALINNSEGITAASPEDALKNLCDAHFSGSITLDESSIARSIHNANVRIGNVPVTEHRWNSIERIRKAIHTFGSKKAPGLDGITPELMKLFSEELYVILQRLFNAMISLNYTPSLLRTSKVIMIPKLGKDDYSNAKAYRPISLTLNSRVVK